VNERAARDVVLLRAIEGADSGREIWSDADRLWASRTAAENVGESATADAFLGERASLALRRLATRYPKLAAVARVPVRWGWAALLAALAAFALGVAGAGIGSPQRINLLAPPVLGLFAWNVGVYALLFALAVLPAGDRTDRDGPLRRSVMRWLGHAAQKARKIAAPLPLTEALGRFASEWPTLAAPLWRQRAAWLLHGCAAALAAGAIAGLYLRGIPLEYRASWQSTFLDADDVARLLRVVLAPGAWVTGIAIPDADHLRTIDARSAGENAARWIHLYAATLSVVVVVPRLLLAAFGGVRSLQLARRLPLLLDAPYFRRLLHAWREGTAHVVAVPYSYDVPSASADGFARLMTRVFQSAVDIDWMPAVAYGTDELPDLPPAPAGVVAVFSLGATPERENHRSFVAALAAKLACRAPLFALVDTSAFVDRFHDDPRRIAEREAAWRETLAAQDVEPIFVRLARPDLAAASAVLAERLEAATP
jgi:uncharacterized protein DUF2868